MIGRIWNDRFEAVLEDSGRWSCPADPKAERVLNLIYGTWYYHSAAGADRCRQLAEAAARHGCRYEISGGTEKAP